MIKKRKIVIASLLKPVDDPRMFEKFALSMSQTNKYAINIIGFSTKNIPSAPNISFHPIFNFGRLSFKRLLSPLKYWQKLLEVKPDLIIVNSHDLLIVSAIYRIIFGCQVAYDVQENYRANIIWSGNLPLPVRLVLAWGVRLKEHVASRMIVHFFVAETCYLNECSFINNAFTVLENKALRPSAYRSQNPLLPPFTIELNDWKGPLKFIYTGTIAQSYGIFDCITLMDKWATEESTITFTIIGYCPRADTLRELREIISIRPYIRLIGGDDPVPHPLILEELQKADFSLISYQLNPSNDHCMPTRIWECLAHKVPMIMKKDHPWLGQFSQFEAALGVDFIDPPTLSSLLRPELRMYTKPLPKSYYWEEEAKKLFHSLETLF